MNAVVALSRFCLWVLKSFYFSRVIPIFRCQASWLNEKKELYFQKKWKYVSSKLLMKLISSIEQGNCSSSDHCPSHRAVGSCLIRSQVITRVTSCLIEDLLLERLAGAAAGRRYLSKAREVVSVRELELLDKSVIILIPMLLSTEDLPTTCLGEDIYIVVSFPSSTY